MQNQAKIALVTGGNKGIGLETARQLAQQGISVIIGARSTEKGEAAANQLKSEGLDVNFITLDVTDINTINNAAKEIESKYGRLDILINNAGINLDEFGTPTTQTTKETFQKTFETNFYGLLDTTNAFLPLLKKSPSGRIVNLSSILASLTHQSDPASPIYDFKSAAYDVSKTAVNAYTIHLAHELKNTTVKVNSAHPGWVKTDMGGEQAPMDIVDGAKTSVFLATLPDDGPNGQFFHMTDPMPW